MKLYTGGNLYRPDFETLDGCIAFAEPIWRADRGGVGLGRQPAPSIERPHRGQRRALDHHDHRITLPKGARSRWVILHELAHRPTPDSVAHGEGFVGVLIGLAYRHLDYDAQELMQLPVSMGVRYRVQSIGVVSVHGPAWLVHRAVRDHGPMTEMDLACWCFLSYLQVRAAAMTLIRQGEARWFRRKLQLLDEQPSAVNDIRASSGMAAC